MRMGNKDEIVEIKKIGVDLGDILAIFPAPITKQGGSYYLKMNPGTMRFYNLKVGDQVLVMLSKVKRKP